MKVTFAINYHTQWGESIALVLGDRKFPMNWQGDGNWAVELETKASALLDYTYVLMKDGLIIRPEWEHHCLRVAPNKRTLTLNDSWKECDIPGCRFRAAIPPQSSIATMRSGAAMPSANFLNSWVLPGCWHVAKTLEWFPIAFPV